MRTVSIGAADGNLEMTPYEMKYCPLIAVYSLSQCSLYDLVSPTGRTQEYKNQEGNVVVNSFTSTLVPRLQGWGYLHQGT